MMEHEFSSDTLPSGHQVAGYTLVRFLGRGAMGEVYEAMWNETGAHYALKLLSEEMMNRESAVERFQREAEIMAALDHPCIAKVMDWGFDSGRYWLCIELLGGMVFEEGGSEISTLDDFIRYHGGKLPQEEVQTCMGQFLDALRYAHGKGLVHRDLKPANILLCDEGMKIADFGLVDAAGSEWMATQVEATVAATVAAGGAAETLKISDSNGPRSSEHALLGTFAYMSPEQKKGWAATAQSDLYAAGLVCFYMLTGESSLGLEMPSEIDRNLWKGWDEFIRKALKTRPQDRFDDAGKMYAALSSVSLDVPHENSRSDGYSAQSHATPRSSQRLRNPAKRNTRKSQARSSEGPTLNDNEPPPKAIKRIGVFNLVTGILGLVSFPYNILIALKDPLGKFQHLGDAFKVLEISIYGVNLIVSLFCLISGIGLLSKQEWGRVMAIACAWMSMAMCLSGSCLMAFELTELKSVWNDDMLVGTIGGIIGGFVWVLIYFSVVVSSMGSLKVRTYLSKSQVLSNKSSSGLMFGLLSTFLCLIFISASVWIWVSKSHENDTVALVPDSSLSSGLYDGQSAPKPSMIQDPKPVKVYGPNYYLVLPPGWEGIDSPVSEIDMMVVSRTLRSLYSRSIPLSTGPALSIVRERLNQEISLIDYVNLSIYNMRVDDVEAVYKDISYARVEFGSHETYRISAKQVFNGLEMLTHIYVFIIENEAFNIGCLYHILNRNLPSAKSELESIAKTFTFTGN